MKEVDSALSQISRIRAHVAESTRFMGIAPGLNVLAALFAFLVSGVQSLYPQALVQSQHIYIAVWAAVILATSAVAVMEAVARSRRLHAGMASTMLHVILQKVLPFFAAGVVLTWVIGTFATASIWLLPGLWQMLIALLGFSLLASLPRGILWAAVWYFVCGALVLGLAGRSGALSPWMMGIPFGGGQLIVALILRSANQECQRDR